MGALLSKVQDFISYNNDMSVDWDNTLLAIQYKLESEINDARENDAKFEQALDRLFDRLPLGTGIPTPIAVQTVCSEVAGGDFTKLQTLMAACEAFVERSARFQSKRGRNGGLFRVAVAT